MPHLPLPHIFKPSPAARKHHLEPTKQVTTPNLSITNFGPQSAMSQRRAAPEPTPDLRVQATSYCPDRKGLSVKRLGKL